MLLLTKRRNRLQRPAAVRQSRRRNARRLFHWRGMRGLHSKTGDHYARCRTKDPRVAYHLWLENGRQDGCATAHWLAAQREILDASLSQIGHVATIKKA